MSTGRRRKSRTSSRRVSSKRSPRKKIESGQHAGRAGLELQSYEVGALPLVNVLLDRMRLAEILAEHLPPDDPRTELPTASALLVLLRNVLLAREPIYGVAEWAARFAPDLLDLWDDEVALLHDDRLGRCLDRLFASPVPEMILAVMRHVITEFGVALDELHNDSTTVSFYGVYEGATKEGRRHGRPTPAITWGHSKDHRPDLKQLLYTLTISEDGGVPVYFTTASGNVVDDRTHCQTWEVLHTLVGRPDFLYVADCKLASRENLSYIASRGGRFVTVLPRTYKENDLFRARLRESASSVTWRHLYDVTDEQGELHDRLSACADEMVTGDGYRLFWFHSTRKAELDAATRSRRLQQASAALAELQQRLSGPRTRFRQRVQVEQAVARILEELEVTAWLAVRIEEQPRESFRQATPGRPTERTRYVKHTQRAYALSWELQHAALVEAERDDGVFPLLSNDRAFDAAEVLRAYKRQPLIEKRFSQFKTDFAVAPVYLKNVARIQGLLTMYFLVLLTQTLLERELRRAMAQAEVSSLPLYPEGRPCTRPTTYRIVELFAPIQRHVVRRPEADQSASPKTTAAAEEDGEPVLVTTLTPVQAEIIRLLGLTPANYGH
jgi:transposase